MKGFLFLFFIACAAEQASAQSLVRFEIGPVIGGTTFGTAISTGDAKAGYGGRVVWNISPGFALEYQMAYFPGLPYYATQGAGHVKFKVLESNRGILTLFSVVGPGLMQEEYEVIGGSYHHFHKYASIAIDFGAGMEVSPHRRVGVRLDLTDFYAGRDQVWGHHLDFKAAVMFRF